MILGIGTDLVDVKRIRDSLERHGDRFAEKILSKDEVLEFQQCGERVQAHFLAKRFAAKEATAKALGTGFRDGIKLQDIEVTHTEKGKPELLLSGGAELEQRQLGVTATHISISDEHEHAVAFVIMEKE
ncbi:MAG: holo-ACP synthase [Gammaproteobacteria bacterium]|uniref:Holo-[acyl-carrier-protein] synthase n=1 Tax=Candidatus Thiopontia autotrophica TaxID=2841688 RepID=A0A8J6P8L7_9GAMM|nr:holo-ACP synthase [Candidatus Thiopontia autotrophica]